MTKTNKREIRNITYKPTNPIQSLTENMMRANQKQDF